MLRGKLLWLPTGDDQTRVLFSYSHTYDSPDYNDIAGPNWSSASPGDDARRGDIWGALVPDYYLGLGVTGLPAYRESRSAKVDNFGIEAAHDISDTLRFTSLTGVSRSETRRPSINQGTPGEFLVDGAFSAR